MSIKTFSIIYLVQMFFWIGLKFWQTAFSMFCFHNGSIGKNCTMKMISADADVFNSGRDLMPKYYLFSCLGWIFIYYFCIAEELKYIFLRNSKNNPKYIFLMDLISTDNYSIFSIFIGPITISKCRKNSVLICNRCNSDFHYTRNYAESVEKRYLL